MTIERALTWLTLIGLEIQLYFYQSLIWFKAFAFDAITNPSIREVVRTLSPIQWIPHLIFFALIGGFLVYLLCKFFIFLVKSIFFKPSNKEVKKNKQATKNNLETGKDLNLNSKSGKVLSDITTSDLKSSIEKEAAGGNIKVIREKRPKSDASPSIFLNLFNPLFLQKVAKLRKIEKDMKKGKTIRVEMADAKFIAQNPEYDYIGADGKVEYSKFIEHKQSSFLDSQRDEMRKKLTYEDLEKRRKALKEKEEKEKALNTILERDVNIQTSPPVPPAPEFKTTPEGEVLSNTSSSSSSQKAEGENEKKSLENINENKEIAQVDTMDDFTFADNLLDLEEEASFEKLNIVLPELEGVGFKTESKVKRSFKQPKDQNVINQIIDYLRNDEDFEGKPKSEEDETLDLGALVPRQSKSKKAESPEKDNSAQKQDEVFEPKETETKDETSAPKETEPSKELVFSMDSENPFGNTSENQNKDTLNQNLGVSKEKEGESLIQKAEIDLKGISEQDSLTPLEKYLYVYVEKYDKGVNSEMEAYDEMGCKFENGEKGEICIFSLPISLVRLKEKARFGDNVPRFIKKLKEDYSDEIKNISIGEVDGKEDEQELTFEFRYSKEFRRFIQDSK